MRRFKKETITILFVVGIVLMFYRSVYTKVDNAYISLPLGFVYVQKANSTEWVKATLNMQLLEGDKVKTLEKSRCEIKFADKKIMRIGESSLVERIREEVKRSASISIGKLWINFITQTSDEEQLKVRTPTAVCAIRGTVYHLNCDSIHTKYRVYDGNIEIYPSKIDQGVLIDTSFSIANGKEMILVSDFEGYKKEQEKLFRDFLIQDQKKLQRFQQMEEDAERQFRKKDDEGYQKFVQGSKSWEDFKKELAAFKNYKSYFFNIRKFDLKEEEQTDWIKWNLQRDQEFK